MKSSKRPYRTPELIVYGRAMKLNLLGKQRSSAEPRGDVSPFDAPMAKEKPMDVSCECRLR